jgi:hypothetical protein
MEKQKLTIEDWDSIYRNKKNPDDYEPIPNDELEALQSGNRAQRRAWLKRRRREQKRLGVKP